MLSREEKIAIIRFKLFACWWLLALIALFFVTGVVSTELLQGVLLVFTMIAVAMLPWGTVIIGILLIVGVIKYGPLLMDRLLESWLFSYFLPTPYLRVIALNQVPLSRGDYDTPLKPGETSLFVFKLGILVSILAGVLLAIWSRIAEVMLPLHSWSTLEVDAITTLPVAILVWGLSKTWAERSTRSRFSVNITQVHQGGQDLSLGKSEVKDITSYHASYELRRYVLARLSLSNLSERSVLVKRLFISLVFKPPRPVQDFVERVRKRGNWGDPYAITLAYPDYWGISLILPGHLSTSSFMTTIISVLDVSTGNPIPLLKPFEVPSKSEELLWDLVLVLPDHVALALAEEKMRVSQIAVDLAGRDVVRATANIPRIKISGPEGERVERLVTKAIAENRGRGRISAAEGIKDMETKVQLLVRALDDDEARKEAQERLIEIGAPAVELLVQVLEKRSHLSDVDFAIDMSAQAILHALEKIGEPAVPHLARILDNKSRGLYWIRINAIGALQRIGDPGAVDSLIRALEGGEAYIPAAAADALGSILSGPIRLPRHIYFQAAEALELLTSDSLPHYARRHIYLQAAEALERYGCKDMARRFREKAEAPK